MAFLNPVVAEGIRVMVRQVATTAATVAAGTTVPPATLTPLPSATATPSITTSSAAPSDTLANGPSSSGPPGGNNNNNNNNNGSNNSSPLLFFVALGFGVVFTNLWIIVGVKYCFRYNARSRQMRMAEDGEPINMEAMPRPHRRRREKKLMTMEEVNEKFPMVKYKNWVASRAQEGLPTRGGVSAPPSRPGSVQEADGVIPDLHSKELSSLEDPSKASAGGVTASEGHPPRHIPKESTSSAMDAVPPASTDAQAIPTASESAAISKDPNRASHDEDDEDDEHINAALPPECMGTSGDTCAICIDTLEDDDDVRGLTCGHAFHAVCLDPWLTSRRACCPLCKADYYIPKPRPPAPEPADALSLGVIAVTLPTDPRSNRMNLPGRPRHAFLGLGRTSRPANPQTSELSNRNRARRPQRRFLDRLVLGNPAGPPPVSPAPPPARSPIRPPTTNNQDGNLFSNFRSAFPAFRMGRLNRNQSEGPVASGGNAAITPSNLEAGVRSPTS